MIRHPDRSEATAERSGGIPTYSAIPDFKVEGFKVSGSGFDVSGFEFPSLEFDLGCTTTKQA
jgi:hypothetical protein